ncbi:MAG: hypothetical protein K0S70_810 [Microbacterium sp.]|jgi:hypothetical protein|nr:hypothetical protein [Microbacterium sp.]
MSEWPPEDGATLVDGMPEEEYHAHPALSASGMKQILRSPKHYLQSRAERVEKPEFDVGHAVHALVLGVGAPIVEVPADMLASNGALSTTRAKEFVAQARSEGKVPLKPATFQRVNGSVESVLGNPKARRLLERPGYTEVSLFARDPETDVPLRGRLDRLAGQTIIDVKTTVDVQTHVLRRVVESFNYDLSMETYRFLHELVTGEVAEPAVLVFVEKEAPFDVRVVRLGDEWIDGGWRKMRKAIATYRECITSSVWPGVDEQDGPIEELSPPSWYAAENARAELAVV